MYLPQDINLITSEMIEKLVSEKKREDRHLEYKESLPTNSEKDKHELLKDVSALANSNGGHILYGITADESDKSLPYNIKGLDITDVDSVKQRLENLIRDNIEPRVRLNIESLTVAQNEIIIVIIVFRSWIQPHAIRQTS